MTLQKSLSDLPRESILISGPTGDRTAGQLLDSAVHYSRKLKGRRVALSLSDALTGIEALVAADGSAESITLLPPTLSDQNFYDLIETAGCDLLLTSRMPEGAKTHRVKTILNLGDLDSCPDEAIDRKIESEWHLATSGTTNTPKLVAHTFNSLTRTVRRNNYSRNQVRWGLLYDYCRFAGLQVVLQAIVSGSTLLALANELPLKDRLSTLEVKGCTHLSATPTLWRAILSTGRAKGLPLRQLTLGGEIADARILSALRETYPHARITHIYASTEAGVGFSVKDDKPGFPASYLSEPPAGIQLKLVDRRLQIKTDNFSCRYVGIEDLRSATDGWVDTGDTVEQVGDRIYFLGRASGVINVGGNKVHPEEVERLLLGHPCVHAARVFGIPSSIVGEIVVAEIVPVEMSKDDAALSDEIKAYVRSKTQAFKVPARLNVVEKIEPSASGKLLRGGRQ